MSPIWPDPRERGTGRGQCRTVATDWQCPTYIGAAARPWYVGHGIDGAGPGGRPRRAGSESEATGHGPVRALGPPGAGGFGRALRARVGEPTPPFALPASLLNLPGALPVPALLKRNHRSACRARLGLPITLRERVNHRPRLWLGRLGWYGWAWLRLLSYRSSEAPERTPPYPHGKASLPKE